MANVKIKCEGNDGSAGLKFTITGTDESGKQITDVVDAIDGKAATSAKRNLKLLHFRPIKAQQEKYVRQLVKIRIMFLKLKKSI